MTHNTDVDRYRPHVHFTAQQHWINDPNGLVYFDGEYHLFYQHNPRGNDWGNMSWGHAVSRDLVHWEHLPVALEDDGEVMIFSGSVVVDRHNTSGLGQGAPPPLIALYTGHHRSGERQAQYLAYSHDRGRTWQRHGSQPVLDIGAADFRDPKVFWHAPSGRWVMVLVKADERKVLLYGSPNLREWVALGDFGPAGFTDGIWEVPDLFEVPVENGQTTAWVLKVDLNPGGPWGGSGCQYWVGHFDGTSFHADGDARWVDRGNDFYAAITWSDAPGRPVWLGWMNNWQYAKALPTSPWRGAMTLPRELHLRPEGGRLALVQRPIPALSVLRGHTETLGDTELSDLLLPVPGLAGPALELIAEFEPGGARECGLLIRDDNGNETTIGFDSLRAEVCIDRTRSGEAGFHPAFGARHSAAVALHEGVLRLHVFVDRSSVEVFSGTPLVMTSLIFPSGVHSEVLVFARGTARLRLLQGWNLRSTATGSLAQTSRAADTTA